MESTKKTITTEVISNAKLKGETFLLKLKPSKKIKFKAGQFIMINIKNIEKPFSIASAPSQNTIEILIRMHKEGELTPHVCKLKKGSKLKISGPYGVFEVKPTKRKEIIFIAAGTGIAPFRSMIIESLKKYPDKKITLIYGFREECYFENIFRKLEKKHKNFKLHACCSKPESSCKNLKGRVTEHLKELIKNPNNKEVYICGPVPMVEDVKKRLIKELSFQKDQIHVEEWK